MKKIFILLGIISITLLLGCESDWYPIYEDWLCTINIDGTDLEYIRNSFGNFLLSPDRETLIEYTKNKFYSVSLNDLSSRTLLYDFGDDTDAIYQPVISNSIIAFSFHGEIYTFDIEDRDTTRLTYTSSPSNWRLAFSSDGNKIVYTTKILDSLSTIVVMNSDGSSKHVIFEYNAVDSVNFTSSISIKNLRFVMNDEIILYSLYATSNINIPNGIYSILVNGSDNHCIVEDIYPMYLTVSPNRDYILFADDGYIQRINADGTNHVLLGAAGNDFFDPSISPDGEKILFTYADYPYIMDADGSDRYQVTDIHIGSFYHDQKESFFINNYKILLNLEKQIN
ncbi:MAG: hypothetical protein RAP70_04685 [Candidatus Celaenobacter antarcticus]|nr:hypothetical protein [Candidatus Celaenobacter antarcticus]MDP8314354.1 hypothetical protein [Candidatus Celaenobacter antarcticus]